MKTHPGLLCVQQPPFYERKANMRKSRLYPLAGMASSRQNFFFDKVFFYPKPNEPLHMWLLSPCREARIAVDDLVFAPLAWHETEAAFAVDYGVFSDPTGFFGQLRVENMPWEALAQSYLILTPLLNWKPEGNLAQIERSLWGLSRKDAGMSLLSPHTVEAGSEAEFHVIYRPAISLPAGAQIRFGVPYAFSYPQYELKNEEGYICACGEFSGLQPVRIEKGPEGHERVYVTFELDRELPAGSFFEARYSTGNVYLYPQRYDENEMEYWYTRTPVLNVSVAMPGREDFVFLQDSCAHSMTVTAEKPEKLHLFLPGRRHTGEQAILRGLFTDRYHNPCEGRPDCGFDLLIQRDDGLIRQLDTPLRWVDFHRFEVELALTAPGVYRVVAQNRQGKTISRSNPFQLLAAGDPRPNIYWGDIHVHCGMSDGIGRYHDLFRFGRDMAALDFAASADHACYFTDNEWLVMQDICSSFNQDGRFTTLIGYEWAGKQVHRNLYTWQDRLDLFRGMYPPTSTLDVVYRHFHGREDVVAGPHGSLAHGLIFEHYDPTVERFAEIYSMWGNQDELESEHPPVVPSPNALSVNELIRRGIRLGFTGGGDCHEGHPGFSSCDAQRQGIVPHAFAQRLRYRCGLTAARLPALNRRSLVDALRNGGTYATTGERLLIDFSAQLQENGTHAVCCEYHLNSEQSVLYLLQNGCIIHTEPVAQDGLFQWKGTAQPKDCCYHVKVVQPDGHIAWSSPIWL